VEILGDSGWAIEAEEIDDWIEVGWKIIVQPLAPSSCNGACG
jgi:hypothetical protein